MIVFNSEISSFLSWVSLFQIALSFYVDEQDLHSASLAASKDIHIYETVDISLKLSVED